MRYKRSWELALPTLSAADFIDVPDRQSLDLILSTGFGLNGPAGTAEHFLDAAEALDYAGADIYFDYEANAELTGFSKAAASHGNICRLQTAADLAAAMLRVIAADPDLLTSVTRAMKTGHRDEA